MNKQSSASYEILTLVMLLSVLSVVSTIALVVLILATPLVLTVEALQKFTQWFQSPSPTT